MYLIQDVHAQKYFKLRAEVVWVYSLCNLMSKYSVVAFYAMMRFWRPRIIQDKVWNPRFLQNFWDSPYFKLCAWSETLLTCFISHYFKFAWYAIAMHQHLGGTFKVEVLYVGRFDTFVFVVSSILFDSLLFVYVACAYVSSNFLLLR
jgi:hypothetical protein